MDDAVDNREYMTIGAQNKATMLAQRENTRQCWLNLVAVSVNCGWRVTAYEVIIRYLVAA